MSVLALPICSLIVIKVEGLHVVGIGNTQGHSSLMNARCRRTCWWCILKADRPADECLDIPADLPTTEIAMQGCGFPPLGGVPVVCGTSEGDDADAAVAHGDDAAGGVYIIDGFHGGFGAGTCSAE